MTIIMIIISWALNWFTCDLMVQCAIKEDCYNYIKLSEKFPKWVEIIFKIVFFINNWMQVVAYLTLLNILFARGF